MIETEIKEETATAGLTNQTYEQKQKRKKNKKDKR